MHTLYLFFPEVKYAASLTGPSKRGNITQKNKMWFYLLFRLDQSFQNDYYILAKGHNGQKGKWCREGHFSQI